jgi:hypothetical protein
MYRYTLKVSGPEGKLDERAIKAALDRRLLFGRRPVTFRFGKMRQVDSTLLIELATELSREALLDLLRPLEGQLGIRLDSVGWGWIVSDVASADAQTLQAGDPSRDPYASAQPQQVAEQVYTYGVSQALRLAISLPPGLFLLIIVLFGILLDTPVRDFVRTKSYVWFLFWIPLSLVMTVLQFQLSPLVFTSYVRCDLEGIEIKYWFRRPIRVLWTDVTELDTTFELASVRSPERVLKFPAGQGFGSNQTPMVIKTIAGRSSLHYIGFVPARGAVYKCYDAE